MELRCLFVLKLPRKGLSGGDVCTIFLGCMIDNNWNYSDLTVQSGGRVKGDCFRQKVLV